jgi:outer membrane protein assembly factor BamE (lipoprotein component of BamABCDE complex)
MRMMFHKAQALTLTLLVATSSLLVGCVTPRYKEFKKLKPGMEKDQVIEAAGGPNVSRRWHGKDRWIYDYKETPEGNQTREVHFENGKAVYVGTKVVPAVSAEEQDRINEESNAQEAARTAVEDREWEASRGVARTQYRTGQKAEAATPSRQSDRYDKKFNEAFYGVQNPEAEKTKLAPTFESIE